MVVSLYIHLQKFRVAFYTIDLETIVIYIFRIQETLIASEFLLNSIGSNHIAPNWSLFSPKNGQSILWKSHSTLIGKNSGLHSTLYQFRQLNFILKQYWAKWNSLFLLYLHWLKRYYHELKLNFPKKQPQWRYAASEHMRAQMLRREQKMAAKCPASIGQLLRTNLIGWPGESVNKFSGGNLAAKLEAALTFFCLLSI